MIGVLIIAIPLIIYLISALSVARKNLTNPDDFFIAFRKVGVTAFSSSSIAYAFQISTIYPFLLWGASNFFFVPLLNTICWGLGILLFYSVYSKYKEFIGKDVTIHGLLGEKYGMPVRIIASLLTITAFLGCAIGETYLGSKVLLPLIESKIVMYAIILVAFLIVYCYIAYGGQLSSIRTDQIQLLIAYIGIFGLMLYFICLIIMNGISVSPVLSWSFLIVFFYIAAIFVFRRLKFIKFSEYDSKYDKFLNRSLNVVVVVIFFLVAVSSFIAGVSAKSTTSNINFFTVEGFGVTGVLSLIILPLSFQFIDLSNWQRLLSVKADSPSDVGGLEKNIRRGLLIYSVESPFTWLVFLFLGALTLTALPHFTIKDLLSDIPSQLLNSKIAFERILGYVFIISVLSIMLSTVDSFLMGIIFTFVYDTYPKTRKLLDGGNKPELATNYSTIINTGRIFGLLAISLGFIFFIIFDCKLENGGTVFISLLFAFYSAQLAFLPHVIGILFLKKLPSIFWASISMIAGATVGVGIGVYSVLKQPEWTWYPVLLSLGISATLYFIGWILKKKIFLAL